MRKSATDVMQDILFAATLDAVAAFRAASKNVPNALLRELNAVHPNTAVGDLPAEVQAAITKGVRDAFARLLKEGYTVSPGIGQPPPRDGPPRPRPAPRGPNRPPVVEIKRPPRRPPPKPRS